MKFLIYYNMNKNPLIWLNETNIMDELPPNVKYL
jgi:hypothetical protein